MGIGDALQKAFVWGNNGAQLTPDDIEKRRLLAEALTKNAVDYSPVASPWQGVARVAQGVLGAVDERDLDNKLAAGQKSAAADFAAAMGGTGLGTAASSSIPTPGAAAQLSGTSPAPISPGASNDIQQQFLDTVKNGYDPGNGQKLAVTNPYGLAAIAATGNAESSYSPKLAAGTWADGKNPAGGIMSWNGPRLANLQKFAGGTNGTPEQQGQFFLQENPDLIASLNNAKSVGEAQTLMNNAWAFKGYDVPGNANSAHRLALAQGYLPQFAGQQPPAAGAPAQVASLDPSSGMQPTNATQAIQQQSPTSGYVDPAVTTAYAPQQASAGPGGMPQLPTGSQIPIPTPRPSQPTDQGHLLAAAIAAGQPSQTPNAPAAPMVDPSVSGGASALPSALAPQPIPPAQAQSAAATLLPAVRTAQVAPPSAGPAMNSQALAKALTNPFLSKGQQALIGAVMQQQSARQQALYEQQLKQSDPEYQATLAKAQYEVQHLGQVSPDTAATLKAQAEKPVVVNNRLVSPQDGKVIADYSNPQVTAVEGALVDNGTGKVVYQGPQQTTDIKDYNFAKQNGDPRTFSQFQTDLRAAGRPTTTINTGDNSSAFAKKADEEAATRFGTYISDGNTASRMLGDVQQLADLGTQINTGKGAQVMATIGPYAQALGIDVKGLAPAQAYQAVIDRMAPNMRPAGAGSSSDTDVRMFLNSLPSLGNVPGGNQIITQTLAAIQQQKITAAQIAQKAMLPKENGGITWQEAEGQIRQLGNPYETFNKYRQTLSQGGSQQLPSDSLTVPTTIPGVTIRRKAP